MNNKRLQEIKDSIDFQREILIAHNMNTLCVDEEQELYDYAINLQSKIDKAIILIDKYLEIVDNPDINMQCVKDILKEDK